MEKIELNSINQRYGEALIMASFSWKRGVVRWGIQLLFAVGAPLVFFGELIVISSLSRHDDNVGKLLTQLEPVCSSLCATVYIQIVLFWWYYLASAYAHYRFDKKLAFNYPTYKSFRMWFLISQLSIFIYLWGNDGGGFSDTQLRPILMLIGVPSISITFTWWLSELYCRYAAWKKVGSTSTRPSVGE